MKRLVLIGLMAIYFVACAERAVNSGPDTITKSVHEFAINESALQYFSLPELDMSDMPIVEVYVKSAATDWWYPMQSHNYSIQDDTICIQPLPDPYLPFTVRVVVVK